MVVLNRESYNWGNLEMLFLRALSLEIAIEQGEACDYCKYRD